MRILVTGGRGFLARITARYLADRGHSLTLLSRGDLREPLAGVEVIHADLRDPAAVRVAITEPYDAVAHLAGLGNVRESVNDPLTYFAVNTAGTLNLLTALHDSAPSVQPVVVLASTQTVYGSQHSVPMTEDLPPAPEHPYAQSRLMAEQIMAAHARTGAIGSVAFRMVNLAGAYGRLRDDNARGIIPKVLNAAATGEAITVNGDGSTVRDYIHVTDVAAAIDRAIHATRPGEHHIYNIGSGHGTSVADILRAAEAATGHPVKTEHHPPVPEPPFLVVNNNHARHSLSWDPERSTIETILTDTWTATQAANPSTT